MINIDELKRYFESRVNYPQQGGLGPIKFNLLVKYASYSLFNQRLGIPEQADFNTGVPKVAYARTTKIHSDLIPFKKTVFLYPINNIVSTSNLPDDLVQSTSLRYCLTILENNTAAIKIAKNCGCNHVGDEIVADVTYKNYEGDIRLITEDKWANRVNSSFLKKNIWCPFANQWEFNFDIKPTKVRLDYLSIPIEPNWAYTIVNGVPKYDPDNSVDLQWNATMLEDVVNRMDEIYSRNVSDQFGVEFSRSKIKSGE